MHAITIWGSSIYAMSLQLHPAHHCWVMVPAPVI